MQITKITLGAFNKEYEVFSYNVQFNQGFNAKTGLLAGIPVAESVFIEIASDGGTEFLQMMLDSTATETIDLNFYDGSVLKYTYSFDKAGLVNYNQNIGSTAPSAMNGARSITEDLTFCFQGADLNKITYTAGA